MIVSHTVSGFVLAGGKSSRMGRNKAMLPWNSSNRETLLDHAVDRLRQICASVKICGLQSQSQKLSLPCLSDSLPDTGPLGGIVAALEQSTTDWNLFLAVDLPLVPVIFLQSLLARISTHGGPLCVIPALQGQPQPLCSLLHRSLAPELRRALEAGKYKLTLAFHAAAGQAVDLWEIQDLKAATMLRPEDWFLNVNTPSEWEQARKLAGQEFLPPPS